MIPTTVQGGEDDVPNEGRNGDHRRFAVTFRLLVMLVLGVAVVAALTGLFGGPARNESSPADAVGRAQSGSESFADTAHRSSIGSSRDAPDSGGFRNSRATPNPFLPAAPDGSGNRLASADRIGTAPSLDQSKASGTDAADGAARDRDHSKGSFLRARSTTEQPQQSERVPAEDQEKQLPRTFAISGRVLDQDGLALANIALVAAPIRLFVLAEGEPTPEIDRQRRTMSDARGFYAFNELPNGEYRIHTLATLDYASGQTSARSGAEFADIVLVGPRSVHVHGIVYSATGAPIDHAVVTPAVTGGRSTYSNEYGAYEVQLVLKENTGVSIRARRVGFRDKTVPLRAGDLSQADIALNITMDPQAVLAHVTGTLQDPNQNAVNGQIVQLRSPRLRNNYRARTDAQGNFAFQSVETSDDYVLQIQGDERFQGYRQENLTIASEGVHLPIVLAFQETGTLSGQMVDLDGNPILNFSLTLRSKEAPYASRQVTTDGGGNFFLTAVPAGSLVLSTQSSPRLFVEGIELAAGNDLHVPVVLDWGTYQLRGLVVDDEGTPVQASNIVLRWSHAQDGVRSWSSRKTISDAEGRFVFDRLGPGSHTVQVDVSGFQPARIDHDITKQGYDVIVQLKRSTSSDGSASAG